MFFNRSGISATRVALSSILLATSVLTTPVFASDYDIKATKLAGLELGMSADKAFAALKSSHPGQAIHVNHVVCMHDYLAALKQNKKTAPSRCTRVITVGDSQQFVGVGLVEDIVGGRFGKSVVTTIEIIDNRLKTDADHTAFREHAIAKYGQPDSGANDIYMTWCTGTPAGACNANDDMPSYEDDNRVAADETPYGYSPTAPDSTVTYTIGVHNNNNGVVILSDIVKPTRTLRMFSQAVNPQTTTPGF